MSLQPESLHVGVLCGGPGSERDVSLASARSVIEALEPLVGRVTQIAVDGPGFELEESVDVAFNVIHGTFGEDGQVQEELETRGRAYTGARVESSRLAFDKILSKERFVAAGVNTPQSIVLSPDEARDRAVDLPCVVKPPREGSSVGVHIVRESGEWAAAIADAARYDRQILMERYVEGKELTVGVLADEALPIVHIQPRSGFYDMRNKYPWLMKEGGTDYFCPADLPDDVAERVQAEALAAHRALGVEVYSRVDLLLDADDRPWVLEVNTIPGMTESSLLPKAARAAGIDFGTLCLKIIQDSLTYFPSH